MASDKKINSSSCLLLKIESEELPNDTKISYDGNKIILCDSIGNSVEFEATELTILHSKTIVVNSSAYIITAPNVGCLAGKRYYVRDGELYHEDIPEDSDDETNDMNYNQASDSDTSSDDSDAYDSDTD